MEISFESKSLRINDIQLRNGLDINYTLLLLTLKKNYTNNIIYINK